MLTELCQELRNWFDRERRTGTFAIENGNIIADFLQRGQYFRIIGSIFSDGVHQYPAADLPPETFTGAVWALAIPQEVLGLAEDINAWRAKYEAVDAPSMSPYSAESFGGYSYSKSTNVEGAGMAGSGWKAAFAARLNRWRKI